MPAGAGELPTPCSHVETWGKPLAGSILAACTTERRPAPARCAAAMMTSFRDGPARDRREQKMTQRRSRLAPFGATKPVARFIFIQPNGDSPGAQQRLT
jgi:hypothetical protein